MTLAIKPAPVKKQVRVAAPQATAFRVFTAGFGTWWPASHSIGASPLKEAVLEGHAGGRWFGRLQDGTEAAWGDVLAWEPPARVLLAWRIGADWTYRPDLTTEVEVTFTPQGEATLVTLEHRLLENMGPAGQGARARFDSEGGWGALLDLFAAAAARQA
ncbi:MAG TPA: SRPBCC family protein [Caulobacteraceae bacterium]|jgi:uncharacterized protein YndB with AHSA1/START domain